MKPVICTGLPQISCFKRFYHITTKKKCDCANDQHIPLADLLNDESGKEHNTDLYQVCDQVHGADHIFIVENVLCIVNSSAAVQGIVDKNEYQRYSNHDPVLVFEQQADTLQERYFFLFGFFGRDNAFLGSDKGNHEYDDCQNAEYSKCFCPCREIVTEELYQRQCQVGDEQCAGGCKNHTEDAEDRTFILVLCNQSIQSCIRDIDCGVHHRRNQIVGDEDVYQF